MHSIAEMSMVYSYPESVNGWLEVLGGEAFCANPDLELGVDIEQCKHNIGRFIPLALRALDSAYVANAQAICNKWYDGACPAETFESLFY